MKQQKKEDKKEIAIEAEGEIKLETGTQEKSTRVNEDKKEENRYPKKNRKAKDFFDYLLHYTICKLNDPKTLDQAMK